MLPSVDGAPDALDPMVPAFGPFELLDDDRAARDLALRSSRRQALRMLALPLSMTLVALLVLGVLVGLGVSSNGVRGPAMAPTMPHWTQKMQGTVITDADDELSSTTTPAGGGTAAPAACTPSAWDGYQGCASGDAHVTALRCLPWPRPAAPRAPRLSRAIYINLEADAKRRAWMEGQLRRLRERSREEGRGELAVERVRGVDAAEARRNASFAAVVARGFSTVEYPKVEGKWGVAGCSLSHLAVLRRLREAAGELVSKGEAWLVLEDDAVVKEGLLKSWEELFAHLPEDWEVARLGWFGGSTCKARVNDHVDLALWADPPPSGPCSYCGSHAYVVNPARVDKIVARLEGARIMHVDCLLGAKTPPGEDPAALPELRSYALRPSLSPQNEQFPSDRA